MLIYRFGTLSMIYSLASVAKGAAGSTENAWLLLYVGMLMIMLMLKINLEIYNTLIRNLE